VGGFTVLETTRRRALHFLALLGLGGTGLARAANAAIDSGAEPDAWPGMPTRKLGRTGFDGSRLVFGCGAALMFWGRGS
jgi:hypothetical protein